jgi:hypothetical protein
MPLYKALPDALAGAFDRAQGFQFGQREVVDEPAFVRFAIDGLPAARLANSAWRPRRWCRSGRLMARDQHAVARADQVRLDVVGAVGMALAYEASVCSGRSALAPRWANKTSGRRPGRGQQAGGTAGAAAAWPAAA